MRKTCCIVMVSLLALLLVAGGVSAAEIPIANSGFEVFAEGTTAADALGKVPFEWDLYADAKGTYWSVALTDEKALSGKYSVLIMDSSAQQGLMLRSKPVEVTPGKEYMALINVFNVEEQPYTGKLQVYMEFWSEHGWDPSTLVEWDRTKRVGVPWKATTTFGQWEEFTMTGTAPATAKYVTIGLYCNNAATVKAYVDDVRLGVRD